MFISVFDIFKIGIGPSSSHTMGPMLAANDFRKRIKIYISEKKRTSPLSVHCTLKGSLSYVGKGHATDSAIALGLHGFTPENLTTQNVNDLVKNIWKSQSINIGKKHLIRFLPPDDIIFNRGQPLLEHPNGIIFNLVDQNENKVLTETYFSIGGGFLTTISDINKLKTTSNKKDTIPHPYPFSSTNLMLQMSKESGLSITEMKRSNELQLITETQLNKGLDKIWLSMQLCLERGIATDGILPGGLNLHRRAKKLHKQLQDNPKKSNLNEWICAYAMGVNEENAMGHMVVTAPTNGAAGVIPAVFYYVLKHEDCPIEQVREYLLVASAIGGLIKYRGSISGAEVGCQGEIGAASAMAAAGLCAIRGGTSNQIENAAEIALEHHLGMTCDPVNGLVQVPCIERNGFGAIKAYTAACLALRGSGQHLISLDRCINTMKITGLEMSQKYKETALGGLAVCSIDC